MIKFVYRVLPAFVYYKYDDGNYQWNWKIVIYTKYKEDQGLLEHELEHIRQWYSHGIIIYNLLYRFCRSWRAYFEAKAHIKQMQYPKTDGTYMTIEEAAQHLLWDKYDLRLTEEEALALIKDNL